MALPQQLKAARMSDSTQGALIDNKIGELEGVLCDIFGFTIDVDITASPFSLDNTGRITKQLVAQRAAGPVGWRMRDTVSGKEVRLVVNGTNFDIDENTGSEAVPVWANRFRMAIADGALTGALATVARMGLVPAGDGNATHFLDGTMTFSAPSAAAVPSVRVRHSANQSLSSGSIVTLSMDTEDFDTDNMHSTVTNNSRLTCVTAGKYLIIGQVSFAANALGSRLCQILFNGTTVLCRMATIAAALNTSIECRTIVNLVPGDYVQLQALQSSGSTINAVAAASYAPVLSAYKIG